VKYKCEFGAFKKNALSVGSGSAKFVALKAKNGKSLPIELHRFCHSNDLTFFFCWLNFLEIGKYKIYKMASHYHEQRPKASKVSIMIL
jgi:hypothetical protein